MIETLTEWNTRIGSCGCCPMTECPAPVVVYEYRPGSASFCGTYKGDPDTCAEAHTIYRSLRDGYTLTVYERDENGDCSVTTTSEETEQDPPIFSDPLNGAAKLAEMIAVANGIIADSDWQDAGESASYSNDGFVEDFGLGCTDLYINSVALTQMRFRFRIPTTHTGTYFKITYDIIEEPDGWNATIDDPGYTGDPPIPQVPDPAAPSRTFISEDNVVEWTGPGTGDSTDPSWLTSWVVVDPPEVVGRRVIANIRFTCYHGTKYGVKPQVMGYAAELPDP